MEDKTKFLWILGIVFILIIALVSAPDLSPQLEDVATTTLTNKDVKFNGQPEIASYDYKYSNNSQLILNSKEVHHCSWYPDGPNEHLKHCELEVEFENWKSVKQSMSKDSLTFVGLEKYSPTYYYSDSFTTYYDEYDNSTFNKTDGKKLINHKIKVERRKFADFSPMKDLASFNTRDVYSIKAEFDMPKYATEQFNISLEGKLGLSLSQTTLSLDPNVTACGTLDVEYGNYTMNTSIIGITTDCFIITNNSIELDMKGYNITGDGGLTDYGVDLNGYDNFTVQDGYIYNFGGGMYIQNSVGHLIKNITINSTAGKYGIYFNTVNDSVINNSNLNYSVNRDFSTNYGIYLITSNNNEIRNTDASHLRCSSGFCDAYGIRLSASSNNNLTGITSNENTAPIYLITGSNNNRLTNITANSNHHAFGVAGHGIQISSSNGNNITGSTLNSNDAYGIYLKSSSNNTIITNNNIWNCSTYSVGGGHACVYVAGNYNVFDGNTINDSAEKGILVDGDHNVFKNTNMTNIANTTHTVHVEDNEINNTFLNFSYSGSDTVDTGGELIRQWYFSSQVNYTHNGTEVVGANVSAFNITDDIQFSAESDSNGQTPQWELIEYINNGGTIDYYSNYTLNASFTNWDTNEQSLNLTIETNLLAQQFNISDTTFPLIDILTPANNTNTTDTQIDVNFTYTEINLEECWYTNDSGKINTTIGCEGNLTTALWLEGQNNVTVYINDTVNNVNFSRVAFKVDTTAPAITINNPTGADEHASPTLLDVSLNELGTCIYSLNIGVNNSMNTLDNQSFTDSRSLTNGDYNSVFSCNDTLGNFDSASVSFFFRASQSGGSTSRPTPTPIKLDSINITTEPVWVFNTQNIILVRALNETGGLTEIDSLNFSVAEGNFTMRTFRLRKGEYRANLMVLEQNITEIEITVTATERGKEVSKTIKVELRDPTILESIKETAKSKLQIIEDFFRRYWMQTAIIILLIIAITVVAIALRKKKDN